jgi:hypothetical protein
VLRTATTCSPTETGRRRIVSSRLLAKSLTSSVESKVCLRVVGVLGGTAGPHPHFFSRLPLDGLESPAQLAERLCAELTTEMGALRPCRDGVEDERLPVSGRATVAAGSLVSVFDSLPLTPLSLSMETTRSCWTGWSSSTASSSSTTSVRRVPSAASYIQPRLFCTRCVCLCVYARP